MAVIDDNPIIDARLYLLADANFVPDTLAPNDTSNILPVTNDL